MLQVVYAHLGLLVQTSCLTVRRAVEGCVIARGLPILLLLGICAIRRWLQLVCPIQLLWHPHFLGAVKVLRRRPFYTPPRVLWPRVAAIMSLALCTLRIVRLSFKAPRIYPSRSRVDPVNAAAQILRPMLRCWPLLPGYTR